MWCWTVLLLLGMRPLFASLPWQRGRARQAFRPLDWAVALPFDRYAHHAFMVIAPDAFVQGEICDLARKHQPADC
jgi:hypothetical protein